LLPSQIENLGFVPRLAPIIEGVPQFTVEDVILGAEENCQVEHEANDEDVIDGMGSADPKSWEKAEEGVNSLDEILKKVNQLLHELEFFYVELILIVTNFK
jgi:hypothetical protein